MGVESFCGLPAVCAGVHPCGSLCDVFAAGLSAVCGDTGLLGCVYRSHAGHSTTLLQLSEQIHRGHEVGAVPHAYISSTESVSESVYENSSHTGFHSDHLYLGFFYLDLGICCI